MPKATTKVNKKDIKLADKIVAVATELKPIVELDKEVISALTPKRVKKSKLTEVDYIPELERDNLDMDTDDSQ